MKIVYISTILPSGHFAQYFTNALDKQKNIHLIVYTDKNPKNLEVKRCGTIKLVWEKNQLFVFQILANLLKDKPHLVHIQQEFNMYGGIFTAGLFPVLILLLKLLGFRIVVTIHAAVFKSQVDSEFIKLFTVKKIPFLTPLTLYLFFLYTYRITSIFADKLICHTELLKRILVEDYYVKNNKIVVIPTGIPQKTVKDYKKEPYFFCFGYIVRRKGFQFVFDGFKKFLKHKQNSKYKLILAGGVIKGQEAAYEEIKNMIKKEKLERNIVMTGFLEESQVDKYYGKALAVVIPAIVSMGSSGPLYQAQSFGKCIIASNVGHFKEDIKHMYDGILADNDKWDKAFDLVVKNPKLVQTIEKNVKLKSKTKSISNIAKRHSEAYELLFQN